MKKMFSQSFMLGFILVFLPRFLQILFAIIIVALAVLWFSYKFEKDFKAFKKTKKYKEIKNFIEYLDKKRIVIIKEYHHLEAYWIIFFTNYCMKKLLIE